MTTVVRVPKWLVAVILYLFLVLVVLLARPALLFDAQGYPKTFALGLSEGNSILAPSVAFPLLALMTYFLATMVQVSVV